MTHYLSLIVRSNPLILEQSYSNSGPNISFTSASSFFFYFRIWTSWFWLSTFSVFAWSMFIELSCMLLDSRKSALWIETDCENCSLLPAISRKYNLASWWSFHALPSSLSSHPRSPSTDSPLPNSSPSSSSESSTFFFMNSSWTVLSCLWKSSQSSYCDVLQRRLSRSSPRLYLLMFKFSHQPPHPFVRCHTIINWTMADPEQVQAAHSESEESEGILDRLKKKYKKDQVLVSINQAADVTDLAMSKYAELKKNYNFISFEEADKSKKVTSGHFEAHQMPIFDFNQSMYEFRRDGYCSNPNTEVKGLVFSERNAELKGLQEGWNDKNENFVAEMFDKTSKAHRKEITKQYKQQRQKSRNTLDYLGPWAGYGEKLENEHLTEQQKEMLEQAEAKKQIRIEEARKDEEAFEPYSNFHWSEYTDYKGKSYIEAPVDFKPNTEKCFVPEKNVQTWTTSQKAGFQVAKFFPKSGHFIMAGTAEGKVLLYDVIKDRSLAHTYVGHTKAVRDVQFSNNGTHFLSCAFDGVVRYWDTEYGKVLASFKLKKLPISVRFHPSSDKQNVFMCGGSNKKIMQFDVKTGKKEMEYSQHLGTVNTITFIEENKFISSSDDKKLFIWEYGIPVVTKHVSEPEMHTITSTAVHPSGEFFAGQSSDNQIVIYENKGGNFRRIRAKTFSRHLSAGYACAIDFSNDGQFLISGDERGRIFFYDWKTCKLLRTLDAQASICIGVEWHPSNPTTVLSCGWEGQLKLWEGR